MKNKKPWPTQKAMTQIYDLGLWGSNGDLFYSGSGSHDPKLVDPYIKVVRQFLESFNPKISVCDLGCGDFNIGRALIASTKNYIAIDIVEALIAYNKTKFVFDNVKFQCLDIVKDHLPKGDCVILRQVLQHLSNQEIAALLPKLKKFKYLLLTEHLPHGEFLANADIISGQGIRLKKNSGVLLTDAPFNLKPIKEEELLSIDLDNGKGRIVTTLYHLVETS